MPQLKTTFRWRWLLVGGVTLLFSISIWLRINAARNSLQEERGTGYQFSYPKVCTELTNLGGWVRETLWSCDEDTKIVATCGGGHTDSWQWSSDAAACGAKRLAASEFATLLQGRWVAVAGDSVGRNVFAALLRLASDRRDQHVVLGHRDFEYTLPGGIRASFFWAPYAQNATSLLNQWDEAGQRPSALLVSIGLWHMLHIASVAGFEEDVLRLKAAVDTFVQQQSEQEDVRPVSLFSLTEIEHGKLRAEDKRQKMTPHSVDAYNAVLGGSQLLIPDGPMHLIDIHRLTQGCGAQCTKDGIHYNNATYDAAIQIWANTLQMLWSKGR